MFFISNYKNKTEIRALPVNTSKCQALLRRLCGVNLDSVVLPNMGTTL